jgi:hypothetical protein
MKLSATRAKVMILTLLIIIAPVAYLAILNQIIPHNGLKLTAGWEDNSFEGDLWKLSYNRPVNANISSENETLKIYTSGNLSQDTIVAAQRFSGLDFDLTVYRYLKVSVETSGLDVAARIVIWTDPNHGYVVLLKTYNDHEWHTEIIDLVFFLSGIGVSSSGLSEIELSIQQVHDGSNSVASYRQLSFNSLEST